MKKTKLKASTVKKLLAVKEAILNSSDIGMDMDDFGAVYVNEEAVCGSTACIAGHAIFLSKPRLFNRMAKDALQAQYPKYIYNYVTNDAGDVGRDILGITEEQAQRLFYIENESYESVGWPKKFQKRYDKAKTDKTRRKVAAERIDHFLKTQGAE